MRLLINLREKMIKKRETKLDLIFLFLIVLLYLTINVSATKVTYNFNATYENVNMFAYYYEEGGGNCQTNQNPPNGGPVPTHGACSIFDMTTRSELDSNNGTVIGNVSLSAGEDVMQLFIGLITNITIQDITLINWTWNGDNSINVGNDDDITFLWNTTSSTWLTLGRSVINEDINLSNWTTDFNIINSTNYTHFAIVSESGNERATYTDYVSLEITYNAAGNAPILNIANITNFSTSTPRLSWLNSTDTGDTTSALNYHIQVDDNSDFSSITFQNHSVPERASPTNLTISSIADGYYYWRVRSITSVGLNSSFSATREFRVDTNSPALNITFPRNQTNHSVGNMNINFTFNDVGIGTISSCWWTNSSGNVNNTLTCGTNITSALWNQGNNVVMIYVNDTLNNVNSSTITFWVDTIFPETNITNIGTSTGSQTVRFNHTITETNLRNCFYSVYNSTGGTDVSNTSMTCNANNTQFTVSTFAIFNLFVYANDTSGNTNQTNQTFTTTESTGGGGGAGGGGGTFLSIVSVVPVIGLQDINGTKAYDELDREIIYTVINNYCSERISNEPLAIIDFSENCFLIATDLDVISQRLKEFSIEIPIEDLNKFYKNYKNSLLFQSSETQDIIDRYKLFTSVLGLTNALLINPPSLERPFLINTDANATIYYTFTTNKPLKDCSVISGEENIRCIIGNNTFRVELFIPNPSFFSRVFTGTLSVTTEIDNPDLVEQRKIPLVLRVYNLKHIPKSLFIGGTVLILAFIVFIVRRRNGKKRRLIKKLTNVN